MNFLITGSSSSIGQEVINSLSRNKNNFIYATYSNTKPKNNKKNVKLIKYIISNKQKKFKYKIDVFIHIASLVPSDNKTRKQLIEVNFKNSEKLLSDLLSKNLKKIIFISSMSVYKKNQSLISENSPLEFNDAYGESKLMFEDYLYKLSLINREIKTLILRLPGYVGKNSKNNFISSIKTKIINDEEVVFVNPNSLFNNVIHEKTLSKMMSKFIYNEKRKFLILNPAAKYPMKLKNIIKLMYKIRNKNFKIRIEKTKSKSFLIDTSLSRKLGYEINNTKDEILRFIK